MSFDWSSFSKHIIFFLFENLQQLSIKPITKEKNLHPIYGAWQVSYFLNFLQIEICNSEMFFWGIGFEASAPFLEQ